MPNWIGVQKSKIRLSGGPSAPSIKPQPTRYDQVIHLIHVLRPWTIVEVGTWKGDRAIEMIRAARTWHKTITYVGFDLFEDGTPEMDTEELNAKPHYTLDAVEARIRARRKAPAEQAKVFLVKGNTRKTLYQRHHFEEDVDWRSADLALQLHL